MVLSCGNQKLGKKYSDFISHRIELPESVMAICDGTIKETALSYNHPALIIYKDSTSCTGCTISHLMDYGFLYGQADETGAFDVVILFSPTAEDAGAVIREIVESGNERPVYVDHHGSFAVRNPQIPADIRFHSFLVGKDGFPEFVGDPTVSEKLWKLFNNSIVNQ